MRHKLAVHVRQYAAVTVVRQFFFGVDAADDGDLVDRSICTMYAQRKLLPCSQVQVQVDDFEDFRAVEHQRAAATISELNWQYSHAHEIGAMYPFEAIGDDRTHTK